MLPPPRSATLEPFPKFVQNPDRDLAAAGLRVLSSRRTVSATDLSGAPQKLPDAFETVMTRHDCTKGFFVPFGFRGEALSEIQAFFVKTGKAIVPLTVREILDEELAMKLA